MASRGGMNPDFMKQLQQMQGRIAEVQQKLDETIIEASSGGGAVTVKMNAHPSLQARGDRSGRRRDAAGLDPGSDERRAREDPDEPDAAAGGTGGWHEPSRTDVVSREVTRT